MGGQGETLFEESGNFLVCETEEQVDFFFLRGFSFSDYAWRRFLPHNFPAESDHDLTSSTQRWLSALGFTEDADGL